MDVTIELLLYYIHVKSRRPMSPIVQANPREAMSADDFTERLQICRDEGGKPRETKPKSVSVGLLSRLSL